MLKIIHSFNELEFGSLVTVYEQSNRESGEENDPELSPAEQQLQAEQRFYSYLRYEFFKDTRAFYALWVPQGRCVSALRIEPYRDGYLLSGLETLPISRGKGYATSLVKAVLSFMSEKTSGLLYSHVKRDNLASLAVHKACGFEKYLDHAVYIDGSVFHDSVTLLYYL